MAQIKVKPLQNDLPFGSRITGATQEVLKDETIRRQVNDIFEDRGMIVFEDVEPTSEMQLAVSTVFGRLKDHPVKVVPRVDQKQMPGVIIRHDPRLLIIELDGKKLVGWLPQFQLLLQQQAQSRGGFAGIGHRSRGRGRTGFADGIQLYKAISPELLRRIEGLNILYTLDLLYGHMRFGRPNTFREIEKPSVTDILDQARELPRAVHPAVWTRKAGEKVLHVSPWMAVGTRALKTPRATCCSRRFPKKFGRRCSLISTSGSRPIC